MRLNSTLLLSLSLGLAACGGSSNDSADETMPDGDEVRYRLTFNASWSAQTFPTNFPSGPHFSPVIGATHNDQDVLWARNQISTPGIEQVAETGATSTYRSELEVKVAEGNVDNIFQGSSFTSPGSSSVEFSVNLTHSRVSAISMIAPSPDWFVGIRDIDLYEGGEWAERLEFDLPLYDSGTDTGAQFGSANSDGGSGMIELLTSQPEDTDISAGIHRNSGDHVGRFIIQRI